jgi:hypothetical protein
MHIGIVTFNASESAAVESLLDDLADENSPWGRDGSSGIRRSFGDQTWTISHEALLAQGNAVAAAELASQFRSPDHTPDFVVFYGCAGVLEEENLASAFLVERVNYLSLGTVDSDGLSGEKVTLKNKWLCYLADPPPGVRPLPAISFPLAESNSQIRRKIAGLTTARVAATDKVIHVRPRPAPPPTVQPPPVAAYKAEKWSYAEALGYVADSGEDILVEMESYGIGRTAKSLDILDHILVLRVTTDALTDHDAGEEANERQATLLMKGRAVLGHLLSCLFLP